MGSLNESRCADVFTGINTRRLAISVPVGAALLLASCGDDSTSDSTAVTPNVTAAVGASGPASTATAAPADEIVVQGYKFPPITAAAGSTLKLTDADDEPHTVTADDGSFDTKPFSPSKPTTLTVPTTPGTYAFHCKIHPTMHGTLVVH